MNVQYVGSIEYTHIYFLLRMKSHIAYSLLRCHPYVLMERIRDSSSHI